MKCPPFRTELTQTEGIWQFAYRLPMNDIVFNNSHLNPLPWDRKEAKSKLATMAASCDHQECTQWSLIDRDASW